MPQRGRPKGIPKTGGRVAGTPNKVTASVKAALTEAFDLKGGVPALLSWAQTNETAFYQLWARMLPAEVDVTSNGETIPALAAAAFARPAEPVLSMEPLYGSTQPVEYTE